ncbi:GIY-YIG nuclease family protein [Vogesella facilis]|uniref:GIY-YIG nuclease family protein n=1 Tax=Vogesella facilis TaxID=1655232 RepID=A0ABV7RFZ4_9NEIS
MLTIKSLLSALGMAFDDRIKFVRHKDRTIDLAYLYRHGQLDIYQATQSQPVFDGCDQIVSFIGGEGTLATFVGVYRVAGVELRAEPHWPADFLLPAADGPWPYLYELQPDERFRSLAGRVVIDWGRSALAWHQWANDKDKEVVEVLPAGYVSEFPGYLDLVLSHHELREIIAHPLANRRWHQMLSAVAGVYLIVDGSTGKQYVGSAYGQEGILGRWKQYAANGHGDNKQLVELLHADAAHARHFRFSVLRTLPRDLPSREVIAVENLYKTKLGSRDFGLNAN